MFLLNFYLFEKVTIEGEVFYSLVHSLNPEMAGTAMQGASTRYPTGMAGAQEFVLFSAALLGC